MKNLLEYLCSFITDKIVYFIFSSIIDSLNERAIILVRRKGMKGDDSGEEECKGYKYLRGNSV
jgi:hypothetical protein